MAGGADASRVGGGVGGEGVAGGSLCWPAGLRRLDLLEFDLHDLLEEVQDEVQVASLKAAESQMQTSQKQKLHVS